MTEYDADGTKHYTAKQRRSLHKWCEQVAETLNNAGLDMRVVLKPEFAIDWNKYMVKKYLYKPILMAMSGKESTEDQNTIEPDVIVHHISRHLGDKFEIQLPPWPDRFNQ